MKKNFTLIEVIVSTVILAFVFSGLLFSFAAVRQYVNRANKRLVAANLVRDVLGSLYRKVREDTWNNTIGELANGTHNNIVSVNIDNYSYTGNYTVSNITGRDYRQVNASVYYP